MPVQLFNMDCMDYMKDCDDKSFDLAIVDPPYFEGPQSNGYHGKGYSSINVQRACYYKEAKNWNIPDKAYFEELKRISRNQIIWGANYFNFNNASSGWIVWDKKRDSSTYADAELAYSSFNCSVKIFRYRWNGMLQGNIGNKKLNEIRIHPTQKPITLYKWLLNNYAKPGQRIIDTHLGSGSSAIAAHYFGCDFVGIEIDKDYYKAALKRFNNETRQKTLF